MKAKLVINSLILLCNFLSVNALADSDYQIYYDRVYNGKLAVFVDDHKLGKTLDVVSFDIDEDGVEERDLALSVSPSGQYVTVLRSSQELAVYKKGLGKYEKLTVLGQKWHSFLAGFNGKISIRYVAWSPDSRFLAFESISEMQSNGKSKLFIFSPEVDSLKHAADNINVNGSDYRKEIKWSPNSQFLAVYNHAEGKTKYANLGGVVKIYKNNGMFIKTHQLDEGFDYYRLKGIDNNCDLILR